MIKLVFLITILKNLLGMVIKKTSIIIFFRVIYTQRNIARETSCDRFPLNFQVISRAFRKGTSFGKAHHIVYHIILVNHINNNM